MTSLQIKEIHWDSASAAIGVFGRQMDGASLQYQAQILSLSALYLTEYAAAVAHVRQAARLEPLNPLHSFRRVLLHARFGDMGRAALELEQLKETLPSVPLVDYLRGLLALRDGRPEKARSIASTLETVYPNFVYGKFLKAEAQIVLVGNLGKIEKYLISLPSGPNYEPLWADLLIKMALLHPDDGPAQAEKYLAKKLRPDSTATSLVRRALAWSSASIDELERHLERESQDSRAEELILGCLVRQLERTENNAKAIETLIGLRRRHPERRALKRIESVFVTRLAIENSGASNHEHAIRLIERCLHEQPHDQVYHQNRAALFTLLRERGPYHEAWAALNRHQYRLLLLGTYDAFTLSQTARSHRLFAQHARGGSAAGAQAGIFQKSSDESGDFISINKAQILTDPELLRQWLHHTCAELVFRHCLLSAIPDRLLLHPTDQDEANARVAALTSFADSLAILVPEEGALLAKTLMNRWRRDASTISTRYNGEVGEDKEVRELQLQHLNLLGDLALFCISWQPEPQELAIAEELLGVINAERAFFDYGVLCWLQQQKGIETPYPVSILADYIRRETGVQPGENLTAEQCDLALNSLSGYLLLHMASSAYFGPAATPQEQVTRAMALIDRAQQCNPTEPKIELAAARFLIIGEFYDEARTRLDRFNRLVGGEDLDALAEADKLEQTLKERWTKGTSSNKRQRDSQPPTAAHGSESRIAELERELDGAPTSWPLYEEMVQELIKSQRFTDAIIWADRAVAHCLLRASQMNARALAIETRALQTLSKDHTRAAQLYAVGAHERAHRALESMAATGKLDYQLLFLLGRCQLAAGAPDKARASFAEAAGVCERPLHRTVLRHLTNDIDNAYLEHARSTINETLKKGSPDEALEQASLVFARLQEPAAWLVDFGRVFYSAALTRIGTARDQLSVPRVTVNTPWQQRLNAVLATNDDIERALGISKLAEELHPPSNQQARTLGERARALKHQLTLTETLNKVSRLLTERRFEEVLSVLSQPPDREFAGEPRFLRLRVLAHLGLNQFEQADQVIILLEEGLTHEVRDFIASYPSLLFRQRLKLAHSLLRDVKLDSASEVLSRAQPTNDGERADLAYCQAFGLALGAQQLQREKRVTEARAQYLRAMDLLEAHLGDNSANGQRHVVELYDRLSKEVDSYG